MMTQNITGTRGGAGGAASALFSARHPYSQPLRSYYGPRYPYSERLYSCAGLAKACDMPATESLPGTTRECLAFVL